MAKSKRSMMSEWRRLLGSLSYRRVKPTELDKIKFRLYIQDLYKYVGDMPEFELRNTLVEWFNSYSLTDLMAGAEMSDEDFSHIAHCAVQSDEYELIVLMQKVTNK